VVRGLLRPAASPPLMAGTLINAITSVLQSGGFISFQDVMRQKFKEGHPNVTMNRCD